MNKIKEKIGKKRTFTEMHEFSFNNESQKRKEEHDMIKAPTKKMMKMEQGEKNGF
jgi:hypothetical protein